MFQVALKLSDQKSENADIVAYEWAFWNDISALRWLDPCNFNSVFSLTKLVLTQSGRKTYISFNPQFWKMQQKFPKLAKSIKPCWNEAILIIFAPKCSVEFSLKALMPSEVIQKYWKLKEKQFLSLGAVLNCLSKIFLLVPWQKLL